MKKSELRKLIKEELLKEDSEINKADNQLVFAFIALRKALTKESPEINKEFRKIKDEFDKKMKDFYKKYDL